VIDFQEIQQEGHYIEDNLDTKFSDPIALTTRKCRTFKLLRWKTIFVKKKNMIVDGSWMLKVHNLFHGKGS
jgi:hypothetical protein